MDAMVISEIKPAYSNTPVPSEQHREGANFIPTFLALLLISMLPVMVAGYHFGAGNQGIQIPFLARAIDARLFANDPMVVQTAADYPTFFFQILARLITVDEIPVTYFALHLLTSFAVVLAVFGLARVMFTDRMVAWVAVLLIAAGHHRALAGDDLYSAGFTHTWAVFPLAIASLLAVYRGWPVAAFILAGLVFNLHALTGAYLAAMLGVVAMGEWPERRWRALIGPAFFTVGALPTGLLMLHGAQDGFDAAWIDITHLRSAEHSFPSRGWCRGDADLPRFACLIGLGAIAMSFRSRSKIHRRTVLLAIGAALLMLIGLLFSEWIVIPLVLRAQLFRCTRLLMIVAMCHIAAGIVGSWQTVGRSWFGLFEALLAIVTFACVAIPALVGWLPISLALAIAVGLLHGRLSWVQMIVGCASLLVCVAANRSIGFPLVGILPDGNLGTRNHGWVIGGWVILGVLAFLVAAHRLQRMWLIRLSYAMGVLSYCICTVIAWSAQTQADNADDWVQTQLWARQNTAPESLFLTPSQPGGFRIHSLRSVVSEWRDGTQAYFNATYGKSWQAIMNALPDSGESFEQLDDTALLRLNQQWKASYIVLPIGATDHHLHRVYANPHWAIYEPTIVAPAIAPTTKPAMSPVEIEQRNFMRDVVMPNIEKNRKSDFQLRIVDESGRPLSDAHYEVHQTRQAFNFGCSMSFFKGPPAAVNVHGDFHPPPVTDAEKEYLPQLFNASLIPFSGKWMYIEPREGERHYDDLDAYVDWCTQHQIAMEFHFVSGYEPAWLGKKSVPDRGKAFLKHAQDLVRRYGNRIRYWQVVNELHLLQDSPAVFEEMRRLQPGIQLGISNCAQFYDPQVPHQRDKPLLRGIEDVKFVQSKGVKVDFFGFHGHRPFGVWPEARQMYDALDGFANQGVKIHISEFSCPLDHPILGRLRRGAWTPDLQAEFYEYFYTVCFSHPAVDMINLWGMGPVTWQSGAGLLDDKSQPKPVLEALRHLLRDKWMTGSIAGTLPLDGAVSFRGFHGEYQITVSMDDHVATTSFSVLAGTNNLIRLRWDGHGGLHSP